MNRNVRFVTVIALYKWHFYSILRRNIGVQRIKGYTEEKNNRWGSRGRRPQHGSTWCRPTPVPPTLDTAVVLWYWATSVAHLDVQRRAKYDSMAPLRVISYSTAVLFHDYRKVSNISRTLAGNNIVDHSDVVGASPVGAAPTTSSFST